MKNTHIITGTEFENFLLSIKSNFHKTSVKLDKKGTDILCNSLKIQVKWDKTIEKSGNIWFEQFEKSVGKEYQEWRPTPSDADLYIFGTNKKGGIKWYYFPLKTLLKACRGMDMSDINVNGKGITSRGFLLKLYTVITPLVEREYPRKNDIKIIKPTKGFFTDNELSKFL